MTAHFHVMEARAHARLGDGRACDSALSEAVKEFERRNPEDDPEWISYFDDAELSAEFGHCFRDLGRPTNATQYANQCLVRQHPIAIRPGRSCARGVHVCGTIEIVPGGGVSIRAKARRGRVVSGGRERRRAGG